MRYERVRERGQLVDCAVLVAVGITQSGHRRVLGVSVALSEAEVHWRTFLNSLVRRGLKGVKMIVSDAHAGLNAARRATLPSVPWQRCQFHLQQNVQSYVTRLDRRKPVAQRIRAISNAPDGTEAERLLRQAIEGWHTEAPNRAQWAEEDLPRGLRCLQFGRLPNASGYAPPTASNALTARSNIVPVSHPSFPIPLPVCAWSQLCSPNAMRIG